MPGGRFIDWTIDNEVTDELKGCPCPAGDLIGDVRESELPNVPGVLCRITWKPIALDTSTASLVHFCCNPEGGYMDCPVWRYDKHRIWRGEHSMGDEEEASTADEQTWREDMTGSKYGDTSEMGPIDAAVDEAMASAKRWGVVEGRTGRGFIG